MYLILFRGRPAVGKTKISDALVKKLSLPVIRKDDIIDKLSKFICYKEKVSKAVYEVFFSILCSQKNTGLLIAEFPFNSNQDLKNFLQRARRFNVKVISFLVVCSDIVLWKKRFKKWCEKEKKHLRIRKFEQMEKRYGSLYIKPLPNEIILDSSENIKFNIAKILKNIPKRF